MASRIRFTATWSGAVLVAALVTLLGPAAPTQATDGCLSEQPTGTVFTTVCDDSAQPATSALTMTPTPNADGWIKVNHASFTFSGSYDDADTDPIAFQCQLGTATDPVDSAWQACTSPATYDNLSESGALPYTFFVRAVDSGDNAIDATTCLSVTCTPAATDVPDLDQTPASATFKVDTVVPNSFIFEGPSDGSGSPVVSQPRVTYTIDASESGVSYRCQLDGQTLACDQGQVTLTNLTGGNKVFAVKVTDPAGNEDPSAATKQFTVPYDLRSGTSWKRVSLKGSFAGQVLQTKTKGARIKFNAHNVREVRFLAPAAKNLGKLRIRLGDGPWHTYNLAKGTPTASRSRTVSNSALFSGTITVESLSSGKPVRIDALVFPPG